MLKLRRGRILKTQPTDIDREAASLFEPAPGMLMWRTIAERSVSNRLGSGCAGAFSTLTGAHDESVSIDTDDPATVGAMLAQVEAAAEGSGVTIADRRRTIPGDAERRFMVIIDHAEGRQTTATGPTRGAALVAVMRKLKGES